MTELRGKEELEPRDYQDELFQAAVKENIIACLGTGTGKTFIGVLLIKELAGQIRDPFEKDGKRTVFLVPTVPLVDQQRKVIEDHTDLHVGGYFGDLGVDLWSAEVWEQEFSKNQVLVMVAEVFRSVLQHGFISLNKINLIIFDECHRAVKNHPYSEIMRLFLNYKEPYPRIMGLTASVLNGKCKSAKLEKYIRDLEQTLRSKALVASDVTTIDKYGTKPKEVLYYYSLPPDITSGSINLVLKLLYTAQSYLENTNREGSGFKMDCEPDNNDMFHPFRDCKAFVNEITDALKNMGVWCAFQLLSKYLIEINKSSNRVSDEKALLVFQYLNSVLTVAKNNMQSIMAKAKDPRDLVLVDISHKLKRLADLLKCCNPLMGKKPLCGIVFVQKRVTAYILNVWLNEVAKCQPYKFLKIDFVVGHGMSQSIEGRQTFSSIKQNEVLQKFRKKETNLLIASSVIEEGMDIPQCNLVIRYDPPSDYRSFIQSKGRARASKSRYVIMLPASELEINFLEDLVNYKTIETILLKICKDREVPDELDSVNFWKAGIKQEPYKPFSHEGAPTISLSLAINIVHRYCALLPRDCFTQSKPRTFIKEVPVEGSSNNEYICEMKMPLTSVLKGWIQGRQMESKTLAKMSAALEVCKQLHQAGELNDDHLLPKRKTLPEDEIDLDEIEEIKAMKKTRCYPKQIAPIISGIPPQANTICYVYMINMTLAQIKLGSEDAEECLGLDPQSSPRSYALLTSRPLPALCKFPVFNMAGKIEVEFVPYSEKSITLTSENRKVLSKFQEVTFSELLNLEEELMFYEVDKPSLALFIGAVTRDNKSFSLDWNFMKNVIERYNRKKSFNLTERLRNEGFTNKENVSYLNIIEDFHDSVVFPAHARLRIPGREHYNLHPLYVFKVKEFTDCVGDYKSISKVFNNFHDYEKYFLEKCRVSNLDPAKPMLQCFYCDKPWLCVPQYLNRMGTITSDRNKYDKTLLLPQKVCEIQATPASMRRLAVCLPVILHRLNSLLLCYDLRAQVAKETGIGLQNKPGPCETINFNWTLLDYNLMKKEAKKKSEPAIEYGELVETEPVALVESDHDSDKDDIPEMPEVKNFNRQRRAHSKLEVPRLNLDDRKGLKDFTPPTLGLLLQATTALNASDLFNLERLETVGDAFIKYATSKYAFHAHPFYDEGYLTSLKMKEISNKKLCTVGLRLKLHQILTYSKFEPTTTFLPPGFHVIEGLEEAFAEFKPTIRNLFFRGKIEDLKVVRQADNKTKMINDLKTLGPDEIRIKFIEDWKSLTPTEIKNKLTMDNGTTTDNDNDDVKVSFALRSLQYLSDKKIADLVEALIGAYVISCGTKGALLFVAWLGLKVLPKRDDEEVEQLLKQNVPPMVARFTDIPLAPTALLNDSDFSKERMKYLLMGYHHLENEIGYHFKDKSYLLQAFTHTSYIGNHVTDCYQRLEFLGDAVLDCIITRYLYEDPLSFSPGELSDLRQALVNNSFFAVLAIKYNLHKYLQYAAPALLKMISSFVEKINNKGSQSDLFTDVSLLLNDEECEFAEDIEVPKALGDVIESLAGAIYLDSGYSFNVVWEVFYEMMSKEIEAFRKNIPINPVRRLMEKFPSKGQVIFSDPIAMGPNIGMQVTVVGKTFGGMGVNKKVAKITAAKKALRELLEKR